MRRQSRTRWVYSVAAPWVFSVLAPWALGVGVLVSFTADAGQDPAPDWNVSPLAARYQEAEDSMRASPASFAQAATGDFGQAGAGAPLIQTARLIVGQPDDVRSIPDEREPHVDLKPEAERFPEVDRTHKGDPVVAMRPGYETRRQNAPPALGADTSDQFSFQINGKPATPLAPRASTPGDEALYEAEAAKVESLATTQKSIAAASPTQNASSSTPTTGETRDTQKEALNERALHGATPGVSRAVALSSSTPAQPDALPIEVSSFPRATLALSSPDRPDGNVARPDYAALVDPDKLDREKRCLAEAVYFESRSEPEAGQAAVAQVVLNRVSSGLYPSSICGVVYQNRHRYKACQFSFACEGKSLRITERESWERAVRVASEVMDGHTYIADVGRSTHYHATYVRPRWARALTKMDAIGRHIFYRLKPGQT